MAAILIGSNSRIPSKMYALEWLVDSFSRWKRLIKMVGLNVLRCVLCGLMVCCKLIRCPRREFGAYCEACSTSVIEALVARLQDALSGNQVTLVRA